VICAGVRQVQVSLMAEKASIDYVSNIISADTIVQHIVEFGYSASLLETDIDSRHGSVDLQVHFM